MITASALTNTSSGQGIESILINRFTFPGGEVQVQISADFSHTSFIYIEANLTSSEEILALLMITDAIKRVSGDTPIRLDLRYAPYARQDRVCNPGEALGAKVFADLINLQGYSFVRVWDPHSDVIPALINNCKVADQSVFVGKILSQIPNVSTLISPDAGANKKVLSLAKKFPQFTSVIRADKKRDLKTGKITGTEVYCDVLGDTDVLIVDDICDGGATFVELARKLKTKTTGKIYLYITHGIFSKGFMVFEGLIDKIFVANPFAEISDTNTLVQTI